MKTGDTKYQHIVMNLIVFLPVINSTFFDNRLAPYLIEKNKIKIFLKINQYKK